MFKQGFLDPQELQGSRPSPRRPYPPGGKKLRCLRLGVGDREGVQDPTGSSDKKWKPTHTNKFPPRRDLPTPYYHFCGIQGSYLAQGVLPFYNPGTGGQKSRM